MRLEYQDLLAAVAVWTAAALLAGWLRLQGYAFAQAPAGWFAALSLPVTGLLILFGAPLAIVVLALLPAAAVDKIRSYMGRDRPTEDEVARADMIERLRRPREPGRPPPPLPGEPPSPWGDRPEI